MTRRSRCQLTGARIDGDCLYRTKGGLQCAVGCLIDDDNYSPQLEGHGFGSSDVNLAVRNSNKGIRLNTETKAMLIRLQTLHDDNKPSNWPEKLGSIARDYNLKIPK